MEAEADLMAIGQHCAMPDCHQLDFLPFKCDCCSRTYCLSHRTYSAHSCTKAGAKTLDVLPCPICAKGIHLRAGEDPNLVFERHYSSTDCDPANYARVKQKKKCPVQGCREKLTTINTYTCKACCQAVCLKHRLEGDHKCPGKSAHPLAQRHSANSMAAAAAAAASAAGRSIGSLFQDMRSGAAAANSSSNGSGARQASQQQQQQLQARADAHQQRRQQQQQRPAGRGEARRAAAAAAAQDPANTLHGSADRRRQLLGLQPRQQQQQQQQGAREVCPQCGISFATLAELIQHAEAAHSSGGNAAAGLQQRSGAAEEFACPSCSRRFSDAALLTYRVE
ncbi:hypothetical protein OEZ85_013418 [Tetradesmus obliquus]|uniref:AN1-type domain-containing protein n=1 Tax=Tetradesmus obliquus TaxID=3088 RepID=A0ABY8U5N3_TETOB|nr:hypothetical protein OEZ85_013418 [Tetradesmus obliquus]